MFAVGVTVRGRGAEARSTEGRAANADEPKAMESIETRVYFSANRRRQSDRAHFCRRVST